MRRSSLVFARRRSFARTLSGRAGSYAVLFGFVLIILLGFGALAIDVAYIRLAQMQTQDIADAASQAALYRLRRTGDLADARAAALAIVDQNRVVGAAPDLDDVTFGIWDDTVEPPTFTDSEVRPNAVRVRVSRAGANGVDLFLARLFGLDRADITREATSSARSLHAVLVMDITGSWHDSVSSQVDFVNARSAAVAFLDTLETSYGEYDQIGMTVFTGRYAWEFTPFTTLEEEAATGRARAQWTAMNVASKGGTPRPYPRTCTLKPDSPAGRGSARNNFTAPPGGCYPNMPREYNDEPGTDHTTGITLARTMFEEEPDSTAFRAMVVLTDGAPNGIAANHGQHRVALGHTETRWRQYVGPRPHTVAQIRSESNTLTQEMYEDLGVNTWVVSFREDQSFMHTMPKGIGYYTLTSDSEALVGIFENIANSLPMAIVR